MRTARNELGAEDRVLRLSAIQCSSSIDGHSVLFCTTQNLSGLAYILFTFPLPVTSPALSFALSSSLSLENGRHSTHGYLNSCNQGEHSYERRSAAEDEPVEGAVDHYQG